MAMRALKRMKIQQFFKKNKTAQNFYDKGMGVVDAGYNMGMGQLALQGAGMYTGQGNYVAASNGLISSKSTMDVVPLFQEDSDQGVIISRREYVSEIYGPPKVGGNPQPFVLQQFSINPGLERTFPWLSQIAANYDEYEMIQLIFTFKSTTTESGNQTNGQVGTVIMATNYNSAAKAFDEKFTMMQYDKAGSSRLTESLLHGVECDPNLLSGSRGEYVRTNPVVANQDLKTYDHGLFQIAIANCTADLANQSIGELWVSYTVKLRKPKFFTGKGLAISKDIFLSYPSGSETQTAVMGTAPLRGQQNNIGILLTQTTTPSGNGAIKLTFPAAFAGTLKLMLSLECASMGAYNASGQRTITGNVTEVNDLYGAVQNGIAADGPATEINNALVATTVNPTTAYISIVHVRVQIATNGIDNSFQFNLPNFVFSNPSIGQAYVEVSEYNAGFSYSANNLGASDAPIWVTSQGVVTLP